MTGAELGASGILGVLLPFAVSLLKSVRWPRQAKIALCAGLSLVLAVIVSAVAGDLDLSILASWGVIFATASSVYTALLSKSGIEEKLRRSGVK